MPPARCSICRNYFPKDRMLHTGLGSLGGVCSEECKTAYVKKYRDKRVRRREHREKKFVPGRRLPGTCRDRVRKRDDGRCRWCGTDQNVQIHHVRYRSQGGPDTPKNLISICADCHELAHSNKRKYQPVLFTWLWLYYELGREVTVPAVFRELGWHRTETGKWSAKFHQDWLDAAVAFSEAVKARNQEKE